MLVSLIAVPLLVVFSCVAGYTRHDCVCGVANIEARRITKGVLMKSLKYPWMVRLVNQHDKVYCGGALISDKHVLTASHCVSLDNKSSEYWTRLYAKVESHHLKEGKRIDFANVFIHPKFSSRKDHDDYDMAILAFAKPIQKFSHLVRPICIPNIQRNYIGMNAIVSGWGTVDPNLPKMSAELREGEIEILEPSQCQFKTKLYDLYNFESMMCGHSTKGVDSCQGDSGGPLFVRVAPNVFEVIGVSSFGLSCGGYYAGVYSDVTQSLSWIWNIVNTTGVCPIYPLFNERLYDE